MSLSNLNSQYLYGKVAQYGQLFTTTGKPYVTFTTSDGMEIFTISEGRVKVTSLNRSKNPTRYLNVQIPFEPKALCVNQNEELMCLYNDHNCVIISIHPSGSEQNSQSFNLSLAPLQNDSIIQIIFNNASQDQSELVLLTKNALFCYDIGENLSEPVYTQRFVPDSKEDNNPNSRKLSMYSANSISIVVDPVSIAFGSLKPEDSNPEAAITLFVLTSDFSIYRIYPFFPSRLDVSEKFVLSYFDSVAAKFQSLKETREQTKFMKTLKMAATLCKQDMPCFINEFLPKNFIHGEFAGPIAMQSFADDLYEQHMLKLLSLPGGLLSVIGEASAVIMYYQSDGNCYFEGDSSTLSDSLMIMDTTLFKSQFKVCTGFIRPVTNDALVLVTSKPSMVLVDYSEWMSPFMKLIKAGNTAQFNSIYTAEANLPTTISKVGDFIIPEQSLGFGGHSLDNSDTTPYASKQNKVWLAWNSSLCIASVFGNQGLSLQTFVLNNIETVDESSERKKAYLVKTEKPPTSKYKSYIKGKFIDTVEKSVEERKKQLINLREITSQITSAEIDPNSVDDLASLQYANQALSIVVVKMFDTLSVISQRLTQMKKELEHQVSTVEILSDRRKKLQSRFESQNERITNIQKKQALLDAKNKKIKQNCLNVISAKNEAKDEDLSTQEVAYVNFLNGANDFMHEKQNQSSKINYFLKKVEQSDMSIIMDKKSQVDANIVAQSILRNMRNQLASRRIEINSLKKEIERMNVQ